MQATSNKNATVVLTELLDKQVGKLRKNSTEKDILSHISSTVQYCIGLVELKKSLTAEVPVIQV